MRKKQPNMMKIMKKMVYQVLVKYDWSMTSGKLEVVMSTMS